MAENGKDKFAGYNRELVDDEEEDDYVQRPSRWV